jgi:hypothetical protein
MRLWCSYHTPKFKEILGKLVRSADGSWQCVALGEPVEAADIKGTIETIQSRFLG